MAFVKFLMQFGVTKKIWIFDLREMVAYVQEEGGGEDEEGKGGEEEEADDDNGGKDMMKSKEEGVTIMIMLMETVMMHEFNDNDDEIRSGRKTKNGQHLCLPFSTIFHCIQFISCALHARAAPI